MAANKSAVNSNVDKLKAILANDDDDSDSGSSSSETEVQSAKKRRSAKSSKTQETKKASAGGKNEKAKAGKSKSNGKDGPEAGTAEPASGKRRRLVRHSGTKSKAAEEVGREQSVETEVVPKKASDGRTGKRRIKKDVEGEGEVGRVKKQRKVASGKEKDGDGEEKPSSVNQRAAKMKKQRLEKESKQTPDPPASLDDYLKQATTQWQQQETEKLEKGQGQRHGGKEEVQEEVKSEEHADGKEELEKAEEGEERKEEAADEEEKEPEDNGDNVEHADGKEVETEFVEASSNGASGSGEVRKVPRADPLDVDSKAIAEEEKEEGEEEEEEETQKPSRSALEAEDGPPASFVIPKRQPRSDAGKAWSDSRPDEAPSRPASASSTRLSPIQKKEAAKTAPAPSASNGPVPPPRFNVSAPVKRSKAVVPVASASPVSREEKMLMDTALQKNSLLLTIDVLRHGKPAGAKAGWYPYEVVDAQGEIVGDLTQRMWMPSKRELRQQKETFDSTYYGVGVAPPDSMLEEAQGETSETPKKREAQDKEEPMYSKLSFDQIQDREWFQQRFYGATFTPQWLRGRSTVYVRYIKYQRKSTGIHFNPGRDRQEFEEQLSKRFAVRNLQPRSDIPFKSWKDLMAGQEACMFLHYSDRSAAMEAVATMKDDRGFPLAFKHGHGPPGMSTHRMRGKQERGLSLSPSPPPSDASRPSPPLDRPFSRSRSGQRYDDRGRDRRPPRPQRPHSRDRRYGPLPMTNGRHDMDEYDRRGRSPGPPPPYRPGYYPHGDHRHGSRGLRRNDRSPPDRRSYSHRR